MSVEVSNCSQPKPRPLAHSREAQLSRPLLIRALSEPNAAESVIRCYHLNSEISALLRAPAGVYEGHTVEQHHLMTLAEQRKYRIGSRLPVPFHAEAPQIGERGLIIALSCHDWNKFVPGEEKSKEAEHARTIAAINRHASFLPLSRKQLLTVQAIISLDVLGELFRQSTDKMPSKEEKIALMERARRQVLAYDEYLAELARWDGIVAGSQRPAPHLDQLIQKQSSKILQSARKLGMPAAELLQVVTAFFQCDVAAYTWDAAAAGQQGYPSLDYLFARRPIRSDNKLFVKHATADRLLFSFFYEKLYCALEQSVQQLA